MRQPGRVELPRARALVVLVAAVGAAGQEVHLGLGGRHRRVGARAACAMMRASSASGITFGWPVWNQGPYAHGAGGGGWRPVAAVKRRSASAGRRAGEDAQRERRAPRPPRSSACGAAEPRSKRARLVVVDQHAVAAAREQPGHRVVGGVVAVARRPTAARGALAIAPGPPRGRARRPRSCRPRGRAGRRRWSARRSRRTARPALRRTMPSPARAER